MANLIVHMQQMQLRTNILFTTYFILHTTIKINNHKGRKKKGFEKYHEHCLRKTPLPLRAKVNMSPSLSKKRGEKTFFSTKRVPHMIHNNKNKMRGILKAGVSNGKIRDLPRPLFENLKLKRFLTWRQMK